MAERCIHNHVYPNIQNSINKFQHGFLTGKSTSTQLVDFVTYLYNTLEHSGQTDVIYTDFSKAFDSVSHDLLLHKLVTFGFNGNLLNWLRSYLSDRYQRVVLQGGTSDFIKVTSGVPQGSILGPLLFIIYINDLPDILKHSKPLLFADDTKLYFNVDCVEKCNLIQSDLNALTNWCQKWKLDLNINKCKVLSVTNARKPIKHDYFISGKVLHRVSELKDLGIIIHKKLSWNICM